MPVVATAGHVDHGKSTLIQALTGRDPDRWEEEKRRGMTIDLGFAWTSLPSGTVISFVDVPGHHRFMRNMLTGVGSVDMALFVVAADEGWMPQTEEHLAVLDLLDVGKAVVALTKIDRVNQDRIDLMTKEIRNRLEKTGLAEARIVPVAATTGAGLDELRAALDELVANTVDVSRPRLWVDRSFSMPGAGTVVTGTLNGGSLKTGDTVSIWPGHPRIRIRKLESNEKIVERADPSSRVAVNLVGVDRASIGRGAMMFAPGTFLPSRRMLVKLRPARYESGLAERGAYLLHIGTLSAAVRMTVLEEGAEVLALADLEEPICVQSGDRLIIRDTGRQLVVAGGIVLDPGPPRRRRDSLALGSDLIEAVSAGRDHVATVMLNHRRREQIEVLSAHSGGGSASATVVADGEALSDEEARKLAERATAKLAAFHSENPHEEGMGIAQLAEQLSTSPGLVRSVVSLTDLSIVGQVVTARADEQDNIALHPRWMDARTVLEGSSLAPPTINELGLEGDLLRALIRKGHLVRVSEELVYLPAQIERLTELLASIGRPFTVSEFRQVAGITRKHAVPLLEWTDRENVTIRNGDLRTVRG